MGTRCCLWDVDYFCCSRNRIPLMTDIPSLFFAASAFLCTILSKTYLFPIIISVREFEDRLESTVDLLPYGCCKLFRVISKINVRLCIRSRPYLSKLIRQRMESEAILLIIGHQELLVLRMLGFFPSMTPDERL